MSYNKTGGGNGGGTFGKKLSEEHKRKLSESHVGKKHSTATKRKISETRFGKKHTVSTKNKISEALAGDKNPFFGKKHSVSAKKKMSEALAGDKHPRARAVSVRGITYPTLTAAAEANGVFPSAIRYWIKVNKHEARYV